MAEKLSASGTPWCSTASELRHYITSSTPARRQIILDQSDSVLSAVRTKNCIHAYFISDTPSDLLLIGAVFEKFQQKKSHETVYGLSRPVVLVIVHESQRDSIESVLAVIEQRSAQKLYEILESRVWVLKNDEDDRDSRLVMVAGIPDRERMGDDKKYSRSVKDASERVADMMERCTFDAKQDRFVVFNTACPVLLSSLPEPAFDRINAVVMVGTFKEDSSTGRFRIDDSIYPYGSYISTLSRAADGRFPIVYLDFSFSSSNKIKSLHHLPEFTRAWPRLLPQKNHIRMVRSGLDSLFLNMIRHSGASRDQSSKECAAKAKELLKAIDSQYVWADRSLERSSYEDFNLGNCVANGKEMAAAMNCPINGSPNSLAGLIPLATSHIPSTSLLAARTNYKPGARRTHSADMALSQTGPGYMLIAIQGGTEVDNAFLDVWKDFLSSVKDRSAIPKISKSMAQSWKDFLSGTMNLVEWLVYDEKDRKDGRQDMRTMQKNTVDGTFTTICKSSLGK